MPGRLTGKVAIVTGAGGGIGSECCRKLAAEGAKVVLADIYLQGAERIAEEIKAKGTDAFAVEFDQGKKDSIQNLVDRAITAFGQIDILLNNAAQTQLAGTVDLSIEETTWEIWEETMNVNVTGMAMLTKLVARDMIKRGSGSIVNVASASGMRGDDNQSAYGASKAAVIGFSRYAAVQYGKSGIRCNSVSPGCILTEATVRSGHASTYGAPLLGATLTPRLGLPADIAWLVVFLGSDESTFLTGTNIPIDGGLTSGQAWMSGFRDVRATLSSA